MAAKKAALLEKRMRREREARERKQQQELDQEQKKEAARLVSTPIRSGSKKPWFVLKIELVAFLQIESGGGTAEKGG